PSSSSSSLPSVFILQCPTCSDPDTPAPIPTSSAFNISIQFRECDDCSSPLPPPIRRVGKSLPIRTRPLVEPPPRPHTCCHLGAEQCCNCRQCSASSSSTSQSPPPPPPPPSEYKELPRSIIESITTHTNTNTDTIIVPATPTSPTTTSADVLDIDITMTPIDTDTDPTIIPSTFPSPTHTTTTATNNNDSSNKNVIENDNDDTSSIGSRLAKKRRLSGRIDYSLFFED